LSFWKMKDRARSFGETSAFALLSQIEQAKPTARIHLMGHSFGCIVASAMIAGSGGRGTLQRPVDSLVLIQGALSLWSYCPDIPVAPGKAGYFRVLVGERRVRGPILTTQSERDTALRVMYPAGAGIARQIAYAPGELPRYGALGTFGIQGVDDGVVNMPMLAVDGNYDFRPGMIYNLDGTAYIRNGTGASGAHNDIANPEVAHAVWEAARQSAAN
jgi:pimeloyl-ACP methyl ester carboxylesterase